MELTAREHRTEIGLGQNAGDFLTFVSLDLDLAVLDRATSAAGALHGLGEFFFFGQADADKVFHHRHGLAAASSGLADDVHAAAILFGFGRFRGNEGLAYSGWRLFWQGRGQAIAGK